MIRRSKLFALAIVVILVGLSAPGCSLFIAPVDFTGSGKIEYTTLKTLQSARVFREFALGTAGSVYKNGLMSESIKEKIITVGDELQQAINTAADALIAYKQSAGTGDETLQEKLVVYQALFNEFLEIVTPYVLNASGAEEV